MHLTHITTYICILLTLTTLLSPVTHAYNVFLRPGTEQCFSEILKKNDKLLASFAVASGGHLDIDCKVYGPDTKIVYESTRKMTDNFQFYATTDGEYRVCFTNAMSTITGKTISFHIYAGQKLASVEAAKNTHLSPLENSIVQLSEGVQAVTDTTEYMKIRERVCASTNISTGRRVIGWNIFKCMVLIGTTIVSILYMKNFFEKARTI